MREWLPFWQACWCSAPLTGWGIALGPLMVIGDGSGGHDMQAVHHLATCSCSRSHNRTGILESRFDCAIEGCRGTLLEILQGGFPGKNQVIRTVLNQIVVFPGFCFERLPALPPGPVFGLVSS